jgi:hypothetical protein
LAASCGGHRWASSSNTLSNKRPRFNRPYIPALKDRGFTARLVRSRVRFSPQGWQMQSLKSPRARRTAAEGEAKPPQASQALPVLVLAICATFPARYTQMS